MTTIQLFLTNTPYGTFGQYSYFDSILSTQVRYNEYKVTKFYSAPIRGTTLEDRFFGSTNTAVQDIFYGGGGTDLINGNEGNDRLFGEVGDDIIYGGSSSRHIFNDGNDYLDGGAGNDQLYGGSGNDIVVGGIDNDILDGGTGDDVLFSGSGADILTGDWGLDWFAYGNAGEGGDTITDFTSGQDKLVLNRTAFGLSANNSLLTGTGHPLAKVAFSATTQFRKLDKADLGFYQNVTAALADPSPTALAVITPAYDPINGGISVSLPDDLPGLYSISNGSATLIASFSNGVLPGFNDFTNSSVTAISDILIYG